MILKIQNFSEKKWLKIVSQYDVCHMNLISHIPGHTGWMGSIDLHISRQNPSIETTTSG